MKDTECCQHSDSCMRINTKHAVYRCIHTAACLNNMNLDQRIRLEKLLALAVSCWVFKALICQSRQCLAAAMINDSAILIKASLWLLQASSTLGTDGWISISEGALHCCGVRDLYLKLLYAGICE